MTPPQSEAPAGSALARVVDIVLPVYNEAVGLEAGVRRLHAYLSSSFPLPWHITIVDNASTGAIGAFNGSDPTPTLAQFQQYVPSGQRPLLHRVQLRGPPRRAQRDRDHHLAMDGSELHRACRQRRDRLRPLQTKDVNGARN